MFSWVGDAINEAITNFFLRQTEAAIQLMLSMFSAMNASTQFVLDTPLVKEALIYAQIVAGVYLGAKVTYEAYMTHVARLDGDPDANPGDLLIRAIRAAAVISGVPWLVRQVYVLGSNLAADVAGLTGIDPTASNDTVGGAMSDAVNAMIGYIFFAFLFVIVGVLLTVFILVQIAIRAGELAIAVVAGCFMALGLTNEESQSFSMWWRTLLSLCLAQAIQLFCLKYSFSMLMLDQSVPLLGAIFNLLLFLGGMWVTIKAPATVKEYVMSTGVSSAAGSVMRSVIARRLLK